jgi:hypothetical protein
MALKGKAHLEDLACLVEVDELEWGGVEDAGVVHQTHQRQAQRSQLLLPPNPRQNNRKRKVR